MDDPFFAEDDGEFDDFYGNGARQSAAKRASQAAMPRPSEPRDQAPVRSAPSLAYPDTPASSVASFKSRSTDGGLLSVSTVTPRHGDATHAKPPKKARRRRSQERFDVEWEKDDDVAACFVCANAFSLLKRKHHCRHCGRVICSDCSSFRRFASSRGKHRVCSYCSVEIANSGGRQTLGAGRRPSMSDIEVTTPQHHDHDHRGSNTLRQSIVGAFSSKSADSRSRAHPENRHPVSTSRRSSSHQVASKDQPTSELFDSSDDVWFGEPVNDENGHKGRHGKADHRSQPKAVAVTNHRDSYARPQVVSAPDSLFDVQFTNGNQYDNDSEDDDHDEFAMPRPTSESATATGVPHPTNDFRASSRHSTAGRLDTPLTMDDLQSSSASASYVSSTGAYETAIVVMPPVKTTGADQTFYNRDADHLVVDDAPGYYDSVIHEQANTPNVTPVYSNPSLMPRPSVLAPVSDDSSGTLVEVSDVSNAVAQPSTSKNEDRPPEDKGFTGALKRFFGVSKKKSEAPTKQPASTNSTSAVTNKTRAFETAQQDHPQVASRNELQMPAEMPRPTLIAPARSDHYDDDGVTQTDSDTYDVRHTIASEDKFISAPVDAVSEAPLRHTMAGYVVPSSRADSLMRASIVGTTGIVHAEPPFQQVTRKKSRNSVRSRRDTFDALFDTPAASLTSSARAPNSATLPTQQWTPTYDGRSTVGVDRFDRPRKEDLDDDITRGLGLPADKDRILTRDVATASRTTWDGVTSYRSVGGIPTYATPNTYTSGYESAHQQHYDTHSQVPTPTANEYDTNDGFESARGSDPKRTIMDDLRPKATPPSSHTATRNDSVDDYFAEFERPTEYVFDSATGTYVSANPRRSAQSAIDRMSDINMQSPSLLKKMEFREERLRASTPDIGALEPVREDVSDEIDGIIADKISTLAGELEALKQLLRQRRVRDSPTSKGGASTASRKQSIFDSDGSDGDVNPRPKKPSKSRRRPSSKQDKEVGDRATQKNRRARKDSFASLFEDDQEESVEQTGLGAKTYDALFQIGQTTTSAVENSDDEAGKPKLSGRARKRGSKVTTPRDYGSNSGTENEPHQTESASSRFSRAVGSENVSASWRGEDDIAQGHEVANQAAPPAQKLSKTKVKKDAIDSLFDSDSDQDVGQLYENAATAQVPTVRRHSKRDVAVTSDSEDENRATVPHHRVLGNDASTNAHAHVLIPTTTAVVDRGQGASSDEEFSSTLKNLRGRRKTPPVPAKAPLAVPLVPSPDLSDADDNEGIFQSQSVVDQSSNRPQLSLSAEMSLTDDETVDQFASAPDSIVTHAMMSAPGAFDLGDSSERDDILTEVELIADISLSRELTEVADKEDTEAGDVVHGTESFNYTTPPDDSAFDPLALLDEEGDAHTAVHSGPSMSVRETSSPLVELSPWEQDVSAIGERLKGLRFRDSLLDDSSADVFATSTSLNLEDLFNDRSEGPSDSEEEQHRPSLGAPESFSFEVERKKRPSNRRNPLPAQEEPAMTVTKDVEQRTSDAGDDSEPTQSESVLYGTNTIAADEVQKSILSTVAEKTGWGSMSIASSTGDADLATDIDPAQFQDDWQRLQEQEKERKKKLQLKQRQAQREKLKKQSSSGRSLGKSGSTRVFAPSSTSPTASGSSKSSRTDKEAVEASERKKKKKHRKKAEDESGDANGESQLTRKSEKRRHKRQTAPSNESTDEKGEQGLSESEGVPPSSSRTEL